MDYFKNLVLNVLDKSSKHQNDFYFFLVKLFLIKTDSFKHFRSFALMHFLKGSQILCML